MPKNTSLRPISIFDTSFTYEQALASEEPDTEVKLVAPAPVSGASLKESKTTACVPCVKNHISAIAGSLSESMRFFREGGIKHPEVVDRINKSTQELNAAERIDLHPEKIKDLPPKEKEVAEWAADQIRDLRHSLDHISDKETLEAAISKADHLNNEMISRFIDLLAS